MSCPEAIYKYNRYMGGVDKGDQLRKYYHVRLKCQKNYKYIFWFAFDTTITNAYPWSKALSFMRKKLRTDHEAATQHNYH